MHELAKKLIKEDGHEINDATKRIYKKYDEIILADRMEIREAILYVLNHPDCGDMVGRLDDVLGIPELTLPEKISKFLKIQGFDVPDHIARLVATMAEEHFKP